MAEETIETKLKNYQVLTSWQQEKIAVLEARIKNNESIQAAKCCECERGAIQDYSDLMIKTSCFDDDSYFKNLSYEEIASLAKKSLRLTAENSKFEEALSKIKRIIEIKDKISGTDKVILKIIKENLKFEVEE